MGNALDKNLDWVYKNKAMSKKIKNYKQKINYIKSKKKIPIIIINPDFAEKIYVF